jgi:hypothetical protein
VRRSPRVGPLERLVSVLYLYPFRCQHCSRRFRALRWRHRHGRPATDQREYERIVVRLPVTLTAGGETAHGDTTDLSLGGCAVRTSAGWPAGTTARVTLRPPGGGAAIEVAEAVVRAVREGSLGLQFVHVAGPDQRQLTELIRSMAAPSPGRPPRGRRLPAEMLLVLLIGLAIIAIVLMLMNRVGGPPTR